MESEILINLTAEIVANHVANNTVAVGDIGNLVQQVHGALAALGQPQEPLQQGKVPVVSVRASVKPDYIVCMECGKKQKVLRRHLGTAHGISPQQYRQDYGLPDTYPLIAPNYSETRRRLAKAIGLGTKGVRRADTNGAGSAPKGRRKKAAPAAG